MAWLFLRFLRQRSPLGWSVPQWGAVYIVVELIHHGIAFTLGAVFGLSLDRLLPW